MHFFGPFRSSDPAQGSQPGVTCAMPKSYELKLREADERRRPNQQEPSVAGFGCRGVVRGCGVGRLNVDL